MPTYDYRCTQCGHEVEVVHAIGGTGPETCERCGGVMRKALSAPAIHFKGSGWAKKDAQTASKPKGAGKSDEATGGSSEAGVEGGEKAGAKDAGDAKAKSTSEPPAKAATGTATD